MHQREGLLYDIHQTRMFNYILLAFCILDCNEHDWLCLFFVIEDCHSFSLALQQTPGKL